MARALLLVPVSLVFLITAAPSAAASEPSDGAGRSGGLLGAAILAALDEETLDVGTGSQDQGPFDGPVFDGTIATFDLATAVRQSLFMLTVQHSARMFQQKTRRELGGPFWRDYINSVRGLRGWDDGDSFLVNYVGHPMQGAVSGYIQIQNDGTGRTYVFGRDARYWRSRLQAFAWAAGYSTQFELGPYSEASIGNVGLNRGTMGWVDLVVTPTGGLALIVLEDAVDAKVLTRLERGGGPLRVRILRTLLTPNRSLANMLRMTAPWHRDVRPLPGRERRFSDTPPAPVAPRSPAVAVAERIPEGVVVPGGVRGVAEMPALTD